MKVDSGGAPFASIPYLNLHLRIVDVVEDAALLTELTSSQSVGIETAVCER